MTSPEWEAANEDDSDRFPQTSHASAPESTESHELGSRVVPDPARVARWEFLVQNTADWWSRQKAEEAMRLADEERAALVAEVERLRESERTAWAVHREHVDGMGPIIARHAGDATFERVRADSAEARLDALVADLRGLHNEWSTAATAFWAGSSADVAPAAVLTKVVAKVAAVLDKHTGGAVVTPDEIRRSWDDDDTPRSVFPEPLAERLTRENKELRAEVERLRRGGKELGRILHRTLTDALDASGRHDCIDEDGDGDWAVVWETLAELRPRAEAAEAKVAKVEALVRDCTSGYLTAHAIWAALADAPAEQRAEGGA